MTYAVKARVKGKTIFNFVTPDGQETRQRSNALRIEDLAAAADAADKISENNPNYEVKVTDFETGREIVASRITAARSGDTEAEATSTTEATIDAPAAPVEDSAPVPVEELPEAGTTVLEQTDAEFPMEQTDAETWVDRGSLRHKLANVSGLYRRAPCGASGMPRENRAPLGDCPDCFTEEVVTDAEVDQRPNGWDETATGPTDEASPAVSEATADGSGNRDAGSDHADGPEHVEPEADLRETPKAGLRDDEPVRATGDGVEPEADRSDAGSTELPAPAAELTPEPGEIFHNAADPKGPAHAIVSAEDGHFEPVCQKGRGITYTLGAPCSATDTICDYCYLGVLGPEPQPETEAKPGRPRPNREPARLPEPLFAEQVAGLQKQTLALAAQIAEAGSTLDARNLIVNLRTALQSVQSTLPKGQPRTHTVSDATPTQIAIGPKSVSINGQVFSSMAEAATLVAQQYPSAVECRKYVEKKAAGQSLNARLFLRADVTKGNLPAGVVVFGDEAAA